MNYELYYDIHSNLAIKMEENRKCKKPIQFGDVHNKYFKIKKWFMYYQQANRGSNVMTFTPS